MALNNIETTIILDLYDHDTTPTKIKAIALDSKTRYVLASLRNNGNVYDAGQDTTVTLTIIRPDNTGVQITGETRQIVDLAPEGEVAVYGVYAELSQAALAVKGTLRAQFKLVSGEQILRTEIFSINNGEALDATIEEWAGDLDGHNLDEMAQSIEDLSSDVSEIQDDVSDLKEGLNDIINSAYVTDSASGTVAHFEDGADDVPLKSLKVAIVPAQSGSGDPSPDNVRPISGFNSVKVTRAGKNVFTSKGLTQTLNGITIHSNDDGSFTVNGTATANAQFDLTLNNELKLQSGQYTVGMFADKAVTFDNRNVWWFFYNLDARADIVNCQSPSKTFTLSTITSTRFYLRIISGATVDNVTLYPILVYGSDAPTEFEPYNGTTLTIDFGQTVYCGKLDVLTGILTVYPEYDSYNGETLTGRWISDRDVYAVGTTPTIGAQVVNIGAEGTEIQLEPHEIASFLGANNIFADTGDCTVEYRADTKLYIKRLTDSDTDMIADANIVSGQYFMVGNDLYKATINIASGAQIVVGTNATKVSLSEALNEINA